MSRRRRATDARLVVLGPWRRVVARGEAILAKHLMRPHVLLALYFTIFLNQLDKLRSYTPSG